MKFVFGSLSEVILFLMPIHNFYIFEESVTLPYEIYSTTFLIATFFTYFRALLLYQPVVKDRVQEIGFSSVYICPESAKNGLESQN